MRLMNALAIVFASGCIASCFLPWITVPQTNITLTGIDARAIGFGHPALIHFFFSGIYILFILLNRNWSLRTAFFLQAFNLAWAVRNYISLSACFGGECPEKRIGLYTILLCSLACMAVFFLVKEKK